MARHYMSTEAKCPYYRSEESTVINCEGFQEGLLLRLVFRQKANAFKQQHCRKDWQSCPVARMLAAVEEEEGGV